MIESAILATFLALLELAAANASDQGGPTGGSPPQALPERPGHVFLAGDEVKLKLPRDGERWRLVNYEGKELQPVQHHQREVSCGKPPVGFYRLVGANANEWISIAILEPLRAPTPSNSPVGLDVAMAWFYGKERMDAVANLCALAGVNWARDRLNWGEMEPQRGTFSAANKYDASAAAQARAGLRVLQVIHQSPAWANMNGKRFPLDLRDAYRFFQAMAERWRGQVRAFEPWNEADIPMFGGHTGAEMASFQKAAYLGLKAGNPEIIACLNVFAVHNTNQLADFDQNEAWPCFETYNLHHYEPFENYPKLYADHRAVSAGKPLWVSECALPVKWAGDEKLKEPSDQDLKVQSERVAKTFACSLYEGSAATFYFLLPHYVEGQTQFGILRPDLTPRPAYVALAAVGRLLADARPLGKINLSNAVARAFLFRARPDGRERDVLVAWSTNGQTTLETEINPEAVYDHLGRSASAASLSKLSAAPLFAILPKGSANKLPIIPPPRAPDRLEGEAAPVVLQALWPEEKVDLRRSAYRLSAKDWERIPIFIYNFGSEPLNGILSAEVSEGWQARIEHAVKIAPLERQEVSLQARKQGTEGASLATARLWGDFGRGAKPVLSIRLADDAR